MCEGFARGRVSVVSDTIQEFEGVRFYKCGKYFSNSSVIKRLHRYVWEFHNGPIPNGFEIHHIDEDVSNNQIENLRILKKGEHSSLHSSSEQKRKRMSDLGKRYQKRTAEWHGSESGIEWHRQHYQKNKHKLHKLVEKVCSFCGKTFVAVNVGSDTAFCSNNCTSKHRRASGIDNVERVCVFCGKKFSINKYSKTASCSKSCAQRYRASLLHDD